MRSIHAEFTVSAGDATLGIPFLVAAVAIMTFMANAPPICSAPNPSSLHDSCGHTLRRPSSFFGRHFDSTFLKKFFKHWIPFTSALRVKMQFFLYKRDFPECGRQIIPDDHNTLDMSGFDATHPTRIIVHGWMSQSKGALNRAIKNAYLNLAKRVPQSAAGVGTDQSVVSNTDAITVYDNSGENSDYLTVAHSDFNIIICDWSVISSNVNYFSVVELIEDLGHLLADLVSFLHLRTGLNYHDVYLIGHSLGAQIAGSAGKQARPFRFNTIYALDPAGPKFREQSDEYRIDPSDAEYVESIQTSNSLGFQDPVGHATFYPNYGHDQKKCYIYGCSHRRAYHYFAESITSKVGFWGTLCRRETDNIWILSESGAEFRMGGEPSTPKRGTFYVKTADRPPYALGRNDQPGR